MLLAWEPRVFANFRTHVFVDLLAVQFLALFSRLRHFDQNHLTLMPWLNEQVFVGVCGALFRKSCFSSLDWHKNVTCSRSRRAHATTHWRALSQNIELVEPLLSLLCRVACHASRRRWFCNWITLVTHHWEPCQCDRSLMDNWHFIFLFSSSLTRGYQTCALTSINVG